MKLWLEVGPAQGVHGPPLTTGRLAPVVEFLVTECRKKSLSPIRKTVCDLRHGVSGLTPLTDAMKLNRELPASCRMTKLFFQLHTFQLHTFWLHIFWLHIFWLHIFQLHISVACPVNDWLVADVA